MADPAPHAFFADLARLYPDLDTDFLRSISAEFDQVTVTGGSILVRHGEPSDALYIIISGRLVATQLGDAGTVVRLGEIGRGEMIGEMSLLSGGTRTATVTALRDSRLVRISNQTFLEFMQRHPSVTRQFIQILMSRLVNRSPRNVERLSTVALLPAGDQGVFEPFVQSLETALQGLVSVMRIDRATVESRFPGALNRLDGQGARETDDTGNAVAAWLDSEEQLHGLLLYICDPTPSAWTRLCLRQADRVLVVAGTDAGPTPPGDTERLLYADPASGLRGSELVLLHRSQCTQPLDTAGWLAGRAVRRHHHVRRGETESVARLCRHLIGSSIGLALGGGGARAFAEVGVLRALAEANVPVDVIGGTSMGAVVGALAAQGLDAHAIHGVLRGMLKLKPFSGLTLPLVSLLSGKRLDRTLQMLFGETEIEDLWRRYFCVACNLTRGTVKAAERGKLRRWVGASNAIPGIMPPLVDEGDLFVDGGLLNNVPADIMSTLNAGPVIAVNVSSGTPMRAGVRDDADLSGWRVLMDGLVGRGHDKRERGPRLGRLLVRSMLLASGNHAAAMRSCASLYLTPPLEASDVGDWHSLDALVEAGYAHASKALETWNREATR